MSIFLFLLGAIVGSFLNVCIWRMPRNESIVAKRSHCVRCGKPIPWYDNIPLLSYYLLRGRCRFCQARISFRYFLVELLSALNFLVFYRIYGLTPQGVIYIALFSALLVITFIDLAHKLIPDVISLPGIIIGLALSFIYPGLQGRTFGFAGLLDSGLGALVGASSIYFIGAFGKLIFKKEAMGGGDVKLMAMLGAFLGWKLILLTFFLAPLPGAVAGLVLKYKYKIELIPYGPFLSLGALVSILWGDGILRVLFALY